jgi:hypothetical protein
MSRFVFNPYVRLAVLVAVMAIAAIVLGNEPWGPR